MLDAARSVVAALTGARDTPVPPDRRILPPDDPPRVRRPPLLAAGPRVPRPLLVITFARSAAGTIRATCDGRAGVGGSEEEALADLYRRMTDPPAPGTLGP